jgi:hypothetical protein
MCVETRHIPAVGGDARISSLMFEQLCWNLVLGMHTQSRQKIQCLLQSKPCASAVV